MPTGSGTIAIIGTIATITTIMAVIVNGIGTRTTMSAASVRMQGEMW
ncbi:MAG: hypothetical protein AB7N91_08500 [Candidatus Tectimicrobiota bacterium]